MIVAESFEAACERNAELIAKTINRILPRCESRDEAESFVLEGFWQACQKFSGQCEWGAYAFNRTWFNAIDTMRRFHGRRLNPLNNSRSFGDVRADFAENPTDYDPVDARSDHFIQLVDAADQVAVTMRRLSESQRTIVELYAAGQTFDEIGKKIGVSRSRVQQIRDRAREVANR